MKQSGWLLEALLELVYPEKCVLCGAEPGQGTWAPRGFRVPGLRFWEKPHLCLNCASGLGSGCVRGHVGAGYAQGLQVMAGATTNPDLVKLVGLFKYHGVRGLAWPLAGMMREPLETACREWSEVDALMPVALHSRRRRVRGFNQADILARILGAGSKITVVSDVLVRHRNTGQQAKLISELERRNNLAASFKVLTAPGPGSGRPPGANRIGLIDDLVTSGWTVAAAAESLRIAGWDVKWVLALGLAASAKNSSRRVDTWKGGF